MASARTAAAPADLAEVVREQMTRWDVPGVAVGVLRDGVTEAWGFGVRSLETGQPVTAGTLFQAGSISKVFTATLVMQLVDDGRLALDAPVVSYLPSLRLMDGEARDRVTLRHLLTHTPGFFGDRFEDYGPGDDALSRAIAAFDTLRQFTPPGALWAYCNTGYQLAGAVIEGVLAMGFEAAMRERILEPLGLDRTFYFAHEAITYPVAIGHNKLPGQEIAIARAWARPRARSAQGGVITTVGNLLRFAGLHMDEGWSLAPARAAGVERVSGLDDHHASTRAALAADTPPEAERAGPPVAAGASASLDPRAYAHERGGARRDGRSLLSDAARRAMQQPEVAAGGFADTYGLGWALREVVGGRIVGHGGSTNGFRAQLSLLPERGLALAVLTNGNAGAAAARGIETWWLERHADLGRPRPEIVTLPREALERVAGRYTQPGSEVAVNVDRDGLEVRVVARDPFTRVEVAMPAMHAMPLRADRFLIVDGEPAGETIDIIPGDADRPRFIRLHGRLADPVDGATTSPAGEVYRG